MSTLPPSIVDLEDFNESINWLLYADSKVGKTVLAGQLPNVLILRIEPGTTSAARFKPRKNTRRKIWKINGWEDFEKAYEWIEANPKEFDWIVIDSITALQQKCIRWILDGAVENNPSRDLDIPAIQDHYKWQQIMRRYVTMFQELPVNVMWTAQAMAKETPEGDEIVLPLIQGKDYEIAAWVCAQMDVLTYLTIKKVKVGDKSKTVRRLYGQTIPPFWAGDRYDVIVPYIDDPDMLDVLERIENSGERSKQRAPVSKTARRSAGRTTKKAAARRRAS